MVVVSGGWLKTPPTYPTSAISNNGNVVAPNESNMAAKAILTCRPNSHSFQERTLHLEQPIKVGRSVARAKPTATNAIFDCKVLSRHHALLWYENGKFFLQDTKSSNGTFVNNNKLAPESENHELCSGDIVQFGVDVVENNRKVTHGCIIATIKLYLPDGKEAKASPITNGDKHGMVPLDDLYRLNQLIQEANQRELCLETKLTALQQVLDETRQSAEESWQAFVGEERLLSRVSALENQLTQASKNWGEDRLREELAKRQQENEAYQKAAKEALEKLHVEKLEAVALTMEQERAKITAEQEALLAKEQFIQAQVDLETIAQKLTQHVTEAEEQRMKAEQREQELEANLESESGKLLDLQLKLHELKSLSIQDFISLGFLGHPVDKLIYNQDIAKQKSVISKEEMIAENEMLEPLIKSDSFEDHINLMVAPVDEKAENEKAEQETSEQDEKKECNEEKKRVIFQLPEEANHKEEADGDSDTYADDESEKSDYSDHPSSKTLKYQFQTAQNELKRKIVALETIIESNKLKITELERSLEEEKNVCQQRILENESLKDELVLLQQKYKEICNENQQFKDRLELLRNELESTQGELKKVDDRQSEKDVCESEKSIISNNLISYDQLVSLEEELVLVKERFAQVSEDKLNLQRDLVAMTEQYNIVCNRSHNRNFFYVAPLVFMVLYLLISSMIS